MKKIIFAIGIILALFASGCAEQPEEKVPTTYEKAPTKVIESSLERDLINDWLDEVSDENNIMWIYHMSESGQVLGEWPVVGKVVSMSKSNEPYERIVDFSGTGMSMDYYQDVQNFEGYRSGTPQLANPSGTYGHDLEGVFFFTPDGEYHEIHGGIIHVSSVPLKIDQPVFLTYDIDKEKQEKEKQWESQLKSGQKVTGYTNNTV